jgi:hypothetical protein
LTYRIVDEEVFQVTTRHRLETLVEVEFYSLSGLVDEPEEVDGLIEKIRGELGEFAGGSEGLEPGAVRYDAASQHLLVAVPQPQQQRTEAYLRKLRAAL